MRRGLLVLLHVPVPIRRLQAGDVMRPVLDLKIGFEDLNVHEFALRRSRTFGTGKVESKITVVSENKALHLGQHVENSSPIVSRRAGKAEISTRP